MKMKKNIALFIIFAMVISVLPFADASAAKKVALSTKKLTVKVGSSKVLKLKNNKKKVKWTVISGKKNITLKKKKKTSVTIVGKKKGTAKVQAKVGKKKYVCKVTVKKKGAVVPTATPKVTQTPTPTSQPQVTEEPEAKLEAITVQYDNVIVERTDDVDYTDENEVIFWLGEKRLHYSDGRTEQVDWTGLSITGVDFTVVGDYTAELWYYNEISTTIQVSVAERQSNDDFEYLSNGTIAAIKDCFVDANVNEVVIPDTIDGAEVVYVSNRNYYGEENITSITFPRGMRYLPGIDQSYEFFETFNVDEGNKNFSSVDGVIFDKNQKVLLLYPKNKKTVHYVVPETVTTITYGFKSTGSYLETVTISKNVTKIEFNAFFSQSSDTALKEIIVDEENENYKSVDGVLFTKSMKFLQCYPIAKTTANYRIPTGVEDVYNLFMSDNKYIQSVVIPDTVTNLGVDPFSDCENLKKFYFDTTEPAKDIICSEDFYYLVRDCLEQTMENEPIIYVRSNELREYIIERATKIDEFSEDMISTNYDW